MGIHEFDRKFVGFPCILQESGFKVHNIIIPIQIPYRFLMAQCGLAHIWGSMLGLFAELQSSPFKVIALVRLASLPAKTYVQKIRKGRQGTWPFATNEPRCNGFRTVVFYWICVIILLVRRFPVKTMIFY